MLALIEFNVKIIIFEKAQLIDVVTQFTIHFEKYHFADARSDAVSRLAKIMSLSLFRDFLEMQRAVCVQRYIRLIEKVFVFTRCAAYRFSCWFNTFKYHFIIEASATIIVSGTRSSTTAVML